MISKIFEKIKNAGKGHKLGTFGGVFTPDVLTILGVIMYLRLGWVVGNAGLIGAFAIIIMAKIITICTALSMSSITTNIKIGAGGAYSIISKSLGLEAGGSVGIPFYISQTLSAALYIFGFTEGWLMFFPHHDPTIVAVITWLILLGISAVSAAFAIKTQYIIMAVIAASLLSFFLSPAEQKTSIEYIGNFENADFWLVFAIFFPAVTGIMAGANLSGDLKEPRKAIPYGTLSAIGVTMVIYLGMAYLFSKVVPTEELLNNQMAMAEYSWISELVILGILAATFSSALGSMIGAPRVLQALAVHKSIPFSKTFATRTKNNEPRNAIIFTAAIIIVAILLGNLDALASLLTMFFLVTYGMLNLVVFLQQSMKIISFRPTFKIPRFVSFIGATGCIFIMFLINTVFSVIAIITIISLYFWLTKMGLKTNWGDIRGGMFLVLAERASRMAAKFPRHFISWKPDVLLPIENPKVWGASLLFIKNIIAPSGSLYAFTVTGANHEETKQSLDDLIRPLDDEKLFVNHAVVDDTDFLHAAKLVMQISSGSTFRPNILFLTLGNNPEKDILIQNLTNASQRHELGTVILNQHDRMAFGLQKDVNLWLRDKSPNRELAILLALQLQINWEGKINLVTVAENKESKDKMHKFLVNLSDKTRLPSLTEFHVLIGSFGDALKSAPRADINIFGIADELNFDFMRSAPETMSSSCLYVRDSGQESATV